MKQVDDVGSIKGQLETVKGFVNIEIYFEDGRAFVEVEDTNCDRIVEEITKLGFECFVIEENSSPTTESKHHVELVVDITGMTCNSCSSNIETNIGKLNGVLHIKADHQKNQGIVVYDPSVISKELIIDKIDDMGFDVAERSTTKLQPAQVSPLRLPNNSAELSSDHDEMNLSQEENEDKVSYLLKLDSQL